MEAQPMKEIWHVSEGEYCLQMVVTRFFLKGLNEKTSDAASLVLGGDCQRSDFGGDRSVEVERATSKQLLGGIHNREIANVFCQFKFGSRQHDAFSRISVN